MKHKYTTRELYGDEVYPDLVKQRKILTLQFKEAAIKQRHKAYQSPFMDRDDALINAIESAIDWCDMLLDEEKK